MIDLAQHFLLVPGTLFLRIVPHTYTMIRPESYFSMKVSPQHARLARQFLFERGVFRQNSLHEFLERGRMIELAQVAELMHDDVVGDGRRQERELVVKIKIA